MGRHIPRKRFGQNFLRDETVIRALLAEIAPTGDEHLVEIGPGQGVLTERLIERSGRLDVIEIDRDLAASLRQLWGSRQNLVIHEADALRFDFRALADGSRPLRVVGNLPYNISTPLLFHLFDQMEAISDMHFMLQREVVQRLCAQAGSADYGRLSVMAGYFCRAEPLFEVAPESFFPQPKVVSAVIRLVPHRLPVVDTDLAQLRRVVAAAFSQRRKTLRNALRGVMDVAGLAGLGIDPGARAQELGLEDFARIANFLTETTETPPRND